jgi:hypothetical protein
VAGVAVISFVPILRDPDRRHRERWPKRQQFQPVLEQFGKIGWYGGDAIALGRDQCGRDKARQSQQHTLGWDHGFDALLCDLVRGMPGLGGRHEYMLGRAEFAKPREALALGMIVPRDAGIAVSVKLLAMQVAGRLGIGSKREVRFAAGKFGFEIARIKRQRLQLQPGPDRSQSRCQGRNRIVPTSLTSGLKQ